MNKLRVAYFGSPAFSADFLEKLVGDGDIPIVIVKVVTQADRPVGRAQTLTPTPVKVMGKALGLEVSDRLPNAYDLQDIDIAVLFAYGELVPEALLRAPRYGFWNIHPSNLPLYRGPSPVASALIDCQVATGVTLMKMDDKLDHGPIIDQKTLTIFESEKCPELTQRLSDEGLLLFKKNVKEFVENGYQITMHDQNDKEATYTKLLRKEDGYVEISNLKSQISNSPKELFGRFRGLYPWPGVWTLVNIKGREIRLKITDMIMSGGKIEIRKVQLEGKKEVDYQTFTKAYTVKL